MDLENINLSVWPGDQVEFQIAKNAKTNIQSATRLHVLKRVELPRIQGVVAKIQPKHETGILKSPQYKDSIHFYFREMENNIEPKENMLVEFSVVKDSWNPNTLQATQIKLSKLRGIVEREIRSKGQPTSKTFGTICM